MYAIVVFDCWEGQRRFIYRDRDGDVFTFADRESAEKAAAEMRCERWPVAEVVCYDPADELQRRLRRVDQGYT